MYIDVLVKLSNSFFFFRVHAYFNQHLLANSHTSIYVSFWESRYIYLLLFTSIFFPFFTSYIIVPTIWLSAAYSTAEYYSIFFFFFSTFWFLICILFEIFHASVLLIAADIVEPKAKSQKKNTHCFFTIWFSHAHAEPRHDFIWILLIFFSFYFCNF